MANLETSILTRNGRVRNKMRDNIVDGRYEHLVSVEYVPKSVTDSNILLSLMTNNSSFIKSPQSARTIITEFDYAKGVRTTYLIGKSNKKACCEEFTAVELLTQNEINQYLSQAGAKWQKIWKEDMSIW